MGSLEQHNNCTNLGIFILCGTYAYSCLPLDPPGPCILVFLTPGLTFLKEEEVEQIIYLFVRTNLVEQITPYGEIFPQEKMSPPPDWDWHSSSPKPRFGGILNSAHFYYKLSQGLNEDMEHVVESFISIKDKLTH